MYIHWRSVPNPDAAEVCVPLPVVSDGSWRLCRLSADFELWECALDDLPKRIVAAERGSLRRWLSQLPEFPAELLMATATSEAELWRSMLLLSFLAHVRKALCNTGGLQHRRY